MTLSDRLLDFSRAFDHPVTVWITASVAAALFIAPVVIHALTAAGRVSPEHRARLLRIYRSWLILVPLMLAPILMGAAWTIGAFGILSLLCYREFARATGLFRETAVSLVVVLGILALAFAALDHWYGLFVALAPLTLAVMAAAAIVADRPRGYIQRVGLGAFGFLFFGACLLHLAYFANDADFRPILLLILVTVEANDVFAYICGKVFGRRKLCPNTSPNKTVGGGLGAVLLTMPLVALIGHHVFRGSAIDTPAALVALGLIISIGGQFGDLMLSSVKRDINVKDFAALIPGHGGFLDRFDSLILVAPAVFHFVAYFRGVGLDSPARILTGP